MGYTTKFNGAVSLSRALTFSEAKKLLKMNEDSKVTNQEWGINSYMQWVPTESLDAIVWDGNEKFYDYEELMKKLCEWLDDVGIVANGDLIWSGEDVDDVGTLSVLNNKLTVNKGKSFTGKKLTPMTIDRLSELALEKVTQAGN